MIERRPSVLCHVLQPKSNACIQSAKVRSTEQLLLEMARIQGPPHELDIRNGAVFARNTLLRGTKYGPYELNFTHDPAEKSFAWEVSFLGLSNFVLSILSKYFASNRVVYRYKSIKTQPGLSHGNRFTVLTAIIVSRNSISHTMARHKIRLIAQISPIFERFPGKAQNQISIRTDLSAHIVYAYAYVLVRVCVCLGAVRR